LLDIRPDEESMEQETEKHHVTNILV